MTNAEKFKDVFGFKVCALNKGCCNCPLLLEEPTNNHSECTEDEFWNADYEGKPTIPLSVIGKIHDAIDNADSDDFFEDEHGYIIDSTLTIEHIHEIIDKAVKECTHE